MISNNGPLSSMSGHYFCDQEIDKVYTSIFIIQRYIAPLFFETINLIIFSISKNEIQNMIEVTFTKSEKYNTMTLYFKDIYFDVV